MEGATAVEVVDHLVEAVAAVGVGVLIEKHRNTVRHHQQN